MRHLTRVGSRSLGAEIARHRQRANLTLDYVGERIGLHASNVSRLETGKRKATAEEVSALLAIIGVVGLERERLMLLASGGTGIGGLVEHSNPTTQSRTYLFFETQATTITGYQPLLIPGLAQTPEYAYSVVSAIQVEDVEEDIAARVGRRMARQKILVGRRPTQLDLVLCEAALRLRVGGPRVMAQQLRHLVDLTGRRNVSLRVIPESVPTHAGLTGPFVLLDFAHDPSVVFVEARTTGLFRDDPDEVNLYRLTLTKLLDVALDEQASTELTRSIAADFDKE